MPSPRPDAPEQAHAVVSTTAPTPIPRATTPPVPPTTSPPKPAPPPAPPPAPVVDEQAADPSRIQIPRLGVDAPVIPLGLDASGALEAPADVSETGWFTEGPEPGEKGPAVIAGHLDSLTGPAVFYGLQQLRPGDVIAVVRADQSRVDFTVVRTEQHAKDSFPTDAVYGATPGSELRLVTCGGAFDRSTAHYLDNVIVFASRAVVPA